MPTCFHASLAVYDLFMIGTINQNSYTTFMTLLIFPLKTDSFHSAWKFLLLLCFVGFFLFFSFFFFFLVGMAVLNCCSLSGVSVNDTLQLENTSFLSFSLLGSACFYSPSLLGKGGEKDIFNNAFQTQRLERTEELPAHLAQDAIM